MDENYGLARFISTILYIVEGIILICGLWLYSDYNPIKSWIITGVWLVCVFISTHLLIDSLKLYKLFDAITVTVVSITLGFVYGSYYVILVPFLIYTVKCIFFLDKELITAMFGVQSLAIIILYLVPATDGVATFGTLITVFVVLVLALIGWLARSIVDMFMVHIRESKEQEASLDDLLILVESKVNESEMANHAKSVFLANMSHEIRTPINTVLGLDTMILRESSESEIREYALDIQDAGQSLLALINDILDFSKIESGKMEIVEVEYELAYMLHDVLNMISTKAEAKDLKMITHIDENLPSRVVGDDVRIRQILINLLNNAVKYTEKGSVTFDVRGEVKEDNLRLRFFVRDTGIGIKKEDIPKLFEKFERLEVERNRNIEGTGLGMSITTNLLSLMNSELKVESEYGIGSVFYFELNQKIIDSSPMGDIETLLQNRADSYKYAASFVAPDAKVLVVDDNVMNRIVFCALLKKTEIQITQAESGFECLDLCKQEKFDMIFLDHMMPELDGCETLHMLREMPESLNYDTPTIVLTANSIAGAKEQYIKDGFDDFLSKPIIADKLEAMIVEYLPEGLWKKGSGLTYNQVVVNQEEAFPELEEIRWDIAMDVLKDRELLKNTVIDFVTCASSHSGILKECYEMLMQASRNERAEAFKQYRVQIHSMKTSTAMIGAVALSEIARLLEYAARDEQIEPINGLTVFFVQRWDALAEKLREAFCMEESVSAVSVDYTMVEEYLVQLETAIANGDIDAMDVVSVGLKSFDYPIEQKEIIEAIIQAIFNIDTSNCLSLIADFRNNSIK